MNTRRVLAAVVCALGSIFGCAGDVIDPGQSQPELTGPASSASPGGVASSGAASSAAPVGVGKGAPPQNTHRPPQTQTVTNDTTPAAEGR